MPVIAPLRGWRYDPGRVDGALVTTPPLESILAGDAPEDGAGRGAGEGGALATGTRNALADELYRRHDRNLIRVLHARAFEDDTPQDNRYTRAAAHLDAWRADGLFHQDQESVYLYEQCYSAHGREVVRRSVFARVRLADWGEDGVHRARADYPAPDHEEMQLFRATRGMLEPALAVVEDASLALYHKLDAVGGYAPAWRFTDEAEVGHALWVVDNGASVREVCRIGGASHLTIVENARAWEAAVLYRNEIREAMRAAGRTPPELGGLEADWGLVQLVPSSDPGLLLFPCHRVVRGVEGFSPKMLLMRAKINFSVTAVEDVEAALWAIGEASAPAVAMVLPDGIQVLTLKQPLTMDRRVPAASPAWRHLDLSLLNVLLLEDGMGLSEEQIYGGAMVRAERDAAVAADAVRAGLDGAQAAFLLRPPTPGQLAALTGEGQLMPPDSFALYPGVRAGHVLHLHW